MPEVSLGRFVLATVHFWLMWATKNQVISNFEPSSLLYFSHFLFLFWGIGKHVNSGSFFPVREWLNVHRVLDKKFWICKLAMIWCLSINTIFTPWPHTETIPSYRDLCSSCAFFSGWAAQQASVYHGQAYDLPRQSIRKGLHKKKEQMVSVRISGFSPKNYIAKWQFAFLQGSK